MAIAPIAAIGPAIVPITPVFTPTIVSASPISSVTAPAASAATSAPANVGGGYYQVSGPALAVSPGATQLESDLLKAALLIGLLDDDEKKKSNPLLDLLIASAVVKMYEQIAAMGSVSAVGFVPDGAGGAVGVSISVTA